MKFLINREIIISIIKIKKFHSSLTYIKAKTRNSFASSFKNNKNLKKTNAKKRIETKSMKFSNKFHSSSWKTFHVSFYFLLQKNIKTKKKTRNNFEKTNLQINLAVILIIENKTIKTMFTKPSNKFHPSSAYRNRNRSTQSPIAFLQKEGDQEPIRIFKSYQCLGTWLPPFPFQRTWRSPDGLVKHCPRKTSPPLLSLVANGTRFRGAAVVPR